MSSLPAETLTELAKERTRAAAERTLLVWIQNCLLLIGTSIVVNRSITNLLQRFPGRDPTALQQAVNVGALLLIALGVSLLLLGVWNYHLSLRAIAHLDPRRPISRRLLGFTGGAILLFGILATLIILLTSL